MKNKQQTVKKITLKGYFDELKAQFSKKYKIAEECGVTIRQVDNWISGNTPVPKLAQEKINAILENDFDYEQN